MAESEEYAAEHRPLAGYAALSGSLTAASVLALLAARRAGKELPGEIGARDVLLVGAATQKVSRTITKEKVTSFIRAPFVRYEEGAGYGELRERPRGKGLRLAVGELLGCPYCIGHWVATAFALGLVTAPRTTRLVAFVFAAETVADFLQLAYGAAERRA